MALPKSTQTSILFIQHPLSEVVCKPGFVLVVEILQHPLPEMVEEVRREERTPVSVVVKIVSVVPVFPVPLRLGNVLLEANEEAEEETC